MSAGSPLFYLCNPSAIVGEAFGIFVLGVSLFWISVAQLWFWAKLSRELPSLGTPGLAWFFVNVRIDGWYRTFALVGTSVSIIVAIVEVGFTWWLCWLAFEAWTEGNDDIDVDENFRAVISLLALGFLGMGFIVWVFGLAAAEVMIKANGLTP